MPKNAYRTATTKNKPKSSKRCPQKRRHSSDSFVSQLRTCRALESLAGGHATASFAPGDLSSASANESFAKNSSIQGSLPGSFFFPIYPKIHPFILLLFLESTRWTSEAQGLGQEVAGLRRIIDIAGFTLHTSACRIHFSNKLPFGGLHSTCLGTKQKLPSYEELRRGAIGRGKEAEVMSIRCHVN